jgi:thiol-disulfide isomerase/thioredoxin
MTRSLLLACAAAVLVSAPLRAQESPAAGIERQVAEAVASSRVTVVHLWAPWCPNCRAELAHGAWSAFIAANPGVHFVFVTVWNPADGREVLERNGVGGEPNFTLLLHPNGSRKRGEKMAELAGLPVSWIPTTWVFKDGRLCYAMNYGELRFPMLQQLIEDSSASWDR